MPTPTLQEIGKHLHDWVDCTVLCNPVFTEIRACTWTGHLEMGQNLKYHILGGMTIRLPAILLAQGLDPWPFLQEKTLNRQREVPPTVFVGLWFMYHL